MEILNLYEKLNSAYKHGLQQCSLPHGKVLGGGSTVNFMIHVRGSPHDYDVWAKNGCTGWSYKEVLPYFKKLETVKDITGKDAGEKMQSKDKIPCRWPKGPQCPPSHHLS